MMKNNVLELVKKFQFHHDSIEIKSYFEIGDCYEI